MLETLIIYLIFGVIMGATALYVNWNEPERPFEKAIIISLIVLFWLPLVSLGLVHRLTGWPKFLN